MIFEYNEKTYNFYNIMGPIFSNKDIIKEMDCQIYSNKNMLWFLFIEKYILKGFLSIEYKNDYLYLDNFYIKKEYRNNKIGSKLIENIIIKYNDNNIQLISKNEVAINMFKKFGFKEINKRGKYIKLKRWKK